MAETTAALGANKERHLVLDDFMTALGQNDPKEMAIDANILYHVPKRRNSARHKAVMYLIVGDFISGDKKASEWLRNHKGGTQNALMLTPKGIDAFHSEYFLSKHIESRNKTWNNVLTLFFSGIVAFGVIYSIFKDENKPKEPKTNKSEQKDSTLLRPQNPGNPTRAGKDSE